MISERSLIAPEFSQEEPILPEAFKPYLDQKFTFQWHEDGVACFAADHPKAENATFLECIFFCENRFARNLIYRESRLSFDELINFKGAEFKTRSLIPGDKNLQRACWSMAS